MSLLQVKNLSFSYQGFEAIKDISFTLDKGQILGFLGPNGAGKSTTMKIISGVLQTDSGEVLIDNHLIEDNPQQTKAKIGFLPEHPPLYADLTVNEYLKFCAQIKNIAKNNIATAIEKVLAQCSLTRVRHKLIAHLSKGYQQRVGIAQAIIHQPELIILDEPTVGLDPIQISEIRSLIKNLAKKHAVILSTHILSEVSEICTDVQIINVGKLVYKTKLSDLKSPQSLESIFIEKTYVATA